MLRLFLLKFIILKKYQFSSPKGEKKKEPKLNLIASLSDHRHLLMFLIFQDYGKDHEIQCMNTLHSL